VGKASIEVPVHRTEVLLDIGNQLWWYLGTQSEAGCGALSSCVGRSSNNLYKRPYRPEQVVCERIAPVLGATLCSQDETFAQSSDG
jgi:hypothetical protein